jgi:hypothetical protein
MKASLRSVFRTSSRPAPRLPVSLLAASLALLTTVALTASARAAAIDESIPTSDVLTQLEQRASHASPREQAWLYTELVHSMTEKAGKELSDGDDNAAQATLKQINHYAHLIQTSLARNTSKLKNAEMLMQHTTFRLAQYMHLASGDDRTEMQATLKQLDQVNDALLTQVFQH